MYTPGSREDFDRLYREASPRFLATLSVLLRDRAAAEDCVQEAFLRAFRAWDRWRPDAPPEAWLHRIAIRVAISHRRKELLQQAEEVVRRLGRVRDSARGGDDIRPDLLKALRNLPPKQAAAVVLRHYHGYSNREIAIALGVPERTVASRLVAAKARLQRELAAYQQRSGTGAAPSVSAYK
jgi:RNA polymerase sigma-70 factor (ECF subfamily)